ncbi:GNAT family N-acetyltransferase [Devosia sp. 919]|uniref:GNAT family N-acetyltransferase n=1 Tax=Devosia sp. 919 TaxID=2726065 RepID=UPI00155493C9|nr:GNAT family N-acetyltransferase [Devosia sp. 919]
MTTTDQRLINELANQPAPGSTTSGGGITLQRGLAAAEPAWRALEREAIFTPYQRFDWIAEIARAQQLEDADFVTLQIEFDGSPAALLPLHLHRKAGCTFAAIPGSSFGNSDWMPVRRDAAALLTRPVLNRAFARLRDEAGVDVLSFEHLPAQWRGIDNPLLSFPHQPSPDHFYYADIAPTMLETLPKKRRVDILRGRRRLEETLGPVTLRRATTLEHIDQVHAAFLEHRSVRFRQMGVPNVFAEPHFRALFRDGAIAGASEDKPAVALHALYVAEEIVATAVGTYSPCHYSQYINSNTDGPASKYSLVGLLMFLLVEDLIAAGISSIDMGVGDFAYKTSWTQKTPINDAAIALSAKGTAAAALLNGKRALKRHIKQNDKLWSFAKQLRQWRQPKPD